MILNNLILEDLYKKRCRCADENKEEFSIIKKNQSKKKGKLTKNRKRKRLKYPCSHEKRYKIFQIKYNKKLSLIAKFLLNSFDGKYFYYAIDDILDLFRSNPIERDNLLSILYSPVISLQNSFSINFFDIWIESITINEIQKENKFLTNDYQNFEQFSYITIRLLYKTSEPVQKQEPLW